MAGLNLPAPKHQPEEEFEPVAAPAAPKVSAVPPQGKRKGWVPRAPSDFGDGGAFQEVHVAQYPMDLGRKGKQSSQVLALTTDSSGKARHDLIASVGQREGKTVNSSKDAIVAKQLDEDQLAKPDADAAAENTERTRLALEAMVNSKAAAAHGSLDRALADKKEPQYIRYTPSSQGAAHASGATNRVIRMVEAPSTRWSRPSLSTSACRAGRRHRRRP